MESGHISNKDNIECPYCEQKECGPDKKMLEIQEKCKEITQSALDAFHHAGAAHETLNYIDKLKKMKFDKNDLSPISKLFIDTTPLSKKDGILCDWRKPNTYTERLFFEHSVES
jgi:hypothetical protein